MILNDIFSVLEEFKKKKKNLKFLKYGGTLRRAGLLGSFLPAMLIYFFSSSITSKQKRVYID